MLTSLITHDRIVTTLPKAKELAPLADKLITLAKNGSLHNLRKAGETIQDKAVLVKLFEELGPRYMEREGGYTRVLKLARPRAGDKADMAVIEYVDRLGEIRVAKNRGYFLPGGVQRPGEGLGISEKALDVDGGETVAPPVEDEAVKNKVPRHKAKAKKPVFN